MGFSLDLGSIWVHLRADTSKFEKSMKKAERQMTRASKKMTAIGKKMTLAFTAPMAAIGVLAVRSFAKFDDAMTKSTAIMGNMTDQMRMQMEQTARSISRNGVTSAEELARSYFFLASAGLDATQSIAALGTVEKFAVAGAFDMALATDLLTDAQSALGLTVKDSTQNMLNMTKVSDVLVKANTLANASVEQFSKALTSKAAASLRNLNKDMEEGVAVLAAFADQGIKGELAGERLSIVLRDLQVAAIKKTKVWKKMGLSTFDVNGNMKNMADIIEDLENKFKGMSDQQKKSTAMMLGFQMRSFAAIQTLIGTSDSIRRYETELRKAGGTTEAVARKQLKSFSSQMKILWNNIIDVAIELGKTLVPMVKQAAAAIQDAIGWWRGLNESTRSQITTIALYAAVIGPVLFILGKMISIVTTLTMVIRVLTATMIANPYLAVAAAIGTLLAIMFLYIRETNEASRSTKEMTSALKGTEMAVDSLISAQARLNRFVSLKDLQGQVRAHKEIATILESESIRYRRVADSGGIQVKVTRQLGELIGRLGLQSERFGGKFIKVQQRGGAAVVRTVELVKRLEMAIKETNKAVSDLGTDEGFAKFEDKIKTILEKGTAGVGDDVPSGALFDYMDKMDELFDEGNQIISERTKMIEFETTLLGKSRDEQEKMIAVAEARQQIAANVLEIAELNDLTEKETVKAVEDMLTLRQTEIDKMEILLTKFQARRKQVAEEMKAYRELKRSADQIGNAFAGAFVDIITGAKSAKDAVRDLAKAIAQIAIRQAIAKPIAAAISDALVEPKTSAKGNVFSGGNIVPFATGGIINSPTTFPLANGNVGLAGEKGKEAIMPLERDENGDLGIKMAGGGQRPIIVNFNDTKDADSFKRSQSQWAGMLARAVRK